MAYEGLKADSGRMFVISNSPHDGPLSSVEKAWNMKAANALAEGGKPLTFQDYRDFREQLTEKGLAAMLAESGSPSRKAKGTVQTGSRASVKASSSGYTGAAYSQGDIDRAVARAVTAERERVATVFASDVSFGRERVCADLLANSKGFSAGAIVAELPNLPRDSERGRRPAGSSEQSAAVWKKAIAANYPGLKSADEPATGNSKNSVWDKAIARTFGEQGA